ncbi:MAG: DUF1156 domain-containing protein [Syntrophaceae bacterium]|nr:DUF1156 domain-containing protein [Syntrophaceae bacterium]
MTDIPRLIEYAFPLKQASLDSVHEKNVRHGHISTLHIWPARRPLAACRAALIATLLPDPGTPEKRKELCEKIGGKVVKKIERKKMPNGQIVEREKEVTEGGILHWGRETENKELLDWFRQEIKKAYGGRAPKVLDPFAGGGAIPLEAMRLGCEATAIDINPVAWFILKCTLEYPQKLAGKTWPLPDFILLNETFMRNFFTKAKGYSKTETAKALERLGRKLKEGEQSAFDFNLADKGSIEADLAWHVRAWGQWVLDRARRELARYYPVYADFEPVDATSRRVSASGGTPLLPYEKQPMRLVLLKEDGTPDIDALNKEFGNEYLADKRNPRWIAKSTVAYLWARTVKCKNCRTTLPLLKTRWLCKKDNKRVLLTVDATSRRVSASGGTPLLHYFDPNEPIANLAGNLPHWRQEGVSYFVTFRLADSMPQDKLLQWEQEREVWLKEHPEPHDEGTRKEYYRLFPERFQSWLDAGYGECILARPDVKEIVENALRHFQGERYYLDEFVIMPNHVHALVSPLEQSTLSRILQSWKSYTAHRINKQLGRSGQVWQKESFDHIMRSPAQMERVRQYIRDNPKGKLQEKRRDDASTAMRRDVASTMIVFGIEKDVPVKGSNAAQRREHDKRIGAGTMSRSGAKCPCCETIMTMEDIRLEGQAGRLSEIMTAVVVDGRSGKEYRLPTLHELELVGQGVGHVVGQASLPGAFPLPATERTGTEACPTIEEELKRVFAQIPFGLPEEPLPSKEALGFRVPLYGFDRWKKLFTSRQLLALGTFVKCTRATGEEQAKQGFSLEWVEGVSAYLGLVVSKSLDYNSMLATWNLSTSATAHGFTRWALPITWDFTEANIIEGFSGGYSTMLEWLQISLVNVLKAHSHSPSPSVRNQSASKAAGAIDAIVTDPPYYDAIPYSDLMDFFYVWLRRILQGLSPELDSVFKEPLSPKWIHEQNDGELIDDPSRHEGNRVKSKAVYEDGMARVFQACHNVLNPVGKLVVVFANKQPEAWETLVSALIRSGFVVDASWPIQTEREARTRALSSAALASSVWLVCKKRGAVGQASLPDQNGQAQRPVLPKPGWDNKVLEEMRENIRGKLREFWDAGIRGPDFVWAATGPALEAYSKHPVVKKANDPGQVMTVSEFLTQVRRIVVDFVVGRVLSGSGVSPLEDEEARRDVASTLDEPTCYYLLHRHDFGLDEAPAGACILYAISCGISDRELASTWDLINFTKGRSDVSSLEDEDVDEEDESGVEATSTLEEESSGSKVKLKTWVQRKARSLGYEAPEGKPIPFIDRVHCLMHLWKGGDLHKVDEYLDENGLRRQELFRRLLQSIIELSPHGSEERSLLESISNHIQARGAVKDKPASLPGFER